MIELRQLEAKLLAENKFTGAKLNKMKKDRETKIKGLEKDVEALVLSEKSATDDKVSKLKTLKDLKDKIDKEPEADRQKIKDADNYTGKLLAFNAAEIEQETAERAMGLKKRELFVSDPDPMKKLIPIM